jgi:hypothetical protein
MERGAVTLAQTDRDTRLPGTRPEHELLLRCAAVRLDATRRARIKMLLASPIDWPYVLKTAQRHRVIPLLTVNLRAVCPEAVPASVLDELQARFRKNAISNLLLASETRSLLNLFVAHGIHAIPFKGVTLAASAYGDIALRQFQDTDLWIRRDDAIQAKRLLIEQGYKPDHHLTPTQEAAFLKTECEYAFKKIVYVELQWEIVPRRFSFTINNEALWQRARQIDIEGVMFPMLAAEDLLLILCAHGTKHGWSRLAWIVDIGELIASNPDMDWQIVTERARHTGGERMLWLGLALATELTGATLPDLVVEKVNADSVVKQLGAQVREHLFDAAGDSSQMIESAQFYIRARERWRDRWRCYLRTALAPTVNDIASLRLPRALYFLYYPLRPIRLLWKYGQKRSRGVRE